MKNINNLSKLSQAHLSRAVNVLRSEFEQITGFATGNRKHSKILKIILFGSRANESMASNLGNGFISDYDILVVLNRSELIDHKLWHLAEERLSLDIPIAINIIVHTLSEVNNELKRGQPFFTDIRHSGIVLHESETEPLAEPGLPRPERSQYIPQQHFDLWFPTAKSFLISFQHAVQRGDYNNALLELHQAAECFYTCLLLTLINYKPKTHNLKYLHNLCIRQDQRITEVFADVKRTDQRTFQLLNNAYSEVHHAHVYQSTREELIWLSERIELLGNLTEIICIEKIHQSAIRTPKEWNAKQKAGVAKVRRQS